MTHPTLRPTIWKRLLRRAAPGLLGAGLCLAPAAALACGGYGDFEPPPLEVSDDPPSPAPAEATPAEPGVVDLVICLDASGSMQGLIDDCRRKLWDLCSALLQARPAPKLRVALLSYGGEENPDGRFVVVRTDLTDELDRVYERLMALEARGSTEYVGGVVHTALEGLSWSPEPGAMRLVYVAGNESADQDRERDVRAALGAARARGVVVHAVFCGDERDGDAASWREVAQLGGGRYASIQQGAVVSIETPFDAELTRLGQALNGTYLAYGAQGSWGRANQERQDANAGLLDRATAAARALFKSGGQYCNGSWDLVDACQAEDFDWSQVKHEDLPKSLQGRTPAELRIVVEGLRAQRTALQATIRALGAERQAFIDARRAEQAQGQGALDDALVAALLEQARAAGFRFE